MILPAVGVGGGVFSGRYRTATSSACVDVLRHAFSQGVTLVDTAPYYGDSEIAIGEALRALEKEGFERDQYILITKVGRYGETDFDYSAAAIRASVEASVHRLGCGYLDAVILHDVEFCADEMALESALPELFRLQTEGVTRHVGISGYPLPTLYRIASAWYSRHPSNPIDLVLSYCHFTLQNTRLRDYIRRFRMECGIKHILNASPLAMGLLCDASPPDWHPAAPDLRKAVRGLTAELKARDIDLSDLAIRFALAEAPEGVGCTIIGMASMAEVDVAVEACSKGSLAPSELQAVRLIQQGEFGAAWFDFSWPSP